jgi:tRNA (guanine37-N1)-methyltransferase
MVKKIMPRAYDALGNIVVLKFPRAIILKDRKKFAMKFLEEHKQFKTILEKVEKFSGRLRKPTTKFLAGENTKITSYKENGCEFIFDVDKTYFSPRLSTERNEIASLISKMKGGKDILVMFAGVAPYSIVIGKKCKNCNVKSVELNREASKYARMNVQRNKLKNVEIIQGDVKKVSHKLGKFDVIVMPRPKLKMSFLETAFNVSKKGTIIYYYDFCKADKIDEIVEKVMKESKDCGKNINILNVKKAGEVGPYSYRIRIDFIVS